MILALKSKPVLRPRPIDWRGYSVSMKKNSETQRVYVVLIPQFFSKGTYDHLLCSCTLGKREYSTFQGLLDPEYELTLIPKDPFLCWGAYGGQVIHFPPMSESSCVYWVHKLSWWSYSDPQIYNYSWHTLELHWYTLPLHWFCGLCHMG